MGAHGAASGPDFSAGIGFDAIADGATLCGRVGDEAVLLSRFGDELVAVGGTCTHYGAALADGLVDGETVRCPLHHACFSLRTGAALHAPALDPLDRWLVERDGGTLFVRGKAEGGAEAPAGAGSDAGKVVIVGGGAAGLACANALRRLGHSGAITILSADRDGPCDRPNLSKDYLAGTAQEDWLPLRSADWYEENAIDLRLGVEVERIDRFGRSVHCRSGADHPFDRLLIATGAEPNRLSGPGFDGANVFTLRSIEDSTAIAAKAAAGSRAAIIGSSFIGMEAASALRTRGVEVTVVAPEHVPFEGVFGAEIGLWLQRLHERNGVHFHLGTVASSFEGKTLRLANGAAVDADFVLVGIGVRPRTGLANAAGIPGDRCIPVDAYLETCQPGIFAAGDVAEYPDALTGQPVRIEHWATAERQGEVAAANMLGLKRQFDAVPFFWTEQVGVALRYVGHARRWDEVRVEGEIDSGDFIARYFDRGVHCASASAGRDRESLEDERRFEQRIAEARASGGEPRERCGIQSGAMSVEESGGS